MLIPARRKQRHDERSARDMMVTERGPIEMEAFRMWDEQKHLRFQQLQQRQQESVLTEVERAELAHLVQEIEAAEASYLVPAVERLRRERELLETQNRTLARLAVRKGALVLRLRDFLADAQAERRAIEDELTAVRNPSRDASLSSSRLSTDVGCDWTPGLPASTELNFPRQMGRI
jgi:hypothetical protein